MPRKPRLRSPSGIYHIMVRGIGKMDLFHARSDYEKYLASLYRIKKQAPFQLYAYCLMKNHVHLLIEEGKESISLTMKRLGISYSLYYNKRYERVGHVFQGRYRSEAIKTEQQLMRCCRYIHNNPVKAGMVAFAENYPWTSYKAYVKSFPDELTDTNPLLLMYSSDDVESRQELKSFTERAESDEQMFIDCAAQPISRQELLVRVKQILEEDGININQLQTIPREQRQRILKKVKTESGGSLRGLAEVLEVSRSSISRA